MCITCFAQIVLHTGKLICVGCQERCARWNEAPQKEIKPL